MPFLDLNSHQMHYRIDGDAGSAKPWIMFCNSLGTDMRMWDTQALALARDFRILRYDRRGHGQSTATVAPYTLDDLGRDALAVLDAAGVERVHYCGLSIGGLTAQWLAIHAAERLKSLTVCATASRIGTGDGWRTRIDAVRAGGLTPLLSATAERWFTPRFIDNEPAAVSEILQSFSATSPEAYIGCCAVLADADLTADISEIGCPVLAVSGNDDPVCPPSALQAIADGVQHGHHVSLPGRHIVSLESSAAFNAALAGFLASSDAVSR